MSRRRFVRVATGTANLEYDWPEWLEDMIDEHEPDTLATQQANGVDVRVRGYRTHEMAAGHEARGIKILVRRDVDVIRRVRLDMTIPWTGPKAGAHHAPRRYLALLCEKHETRWWTIGAHLPTYNNPKAQAESLQRLARFVNNHPIPTYIAADWNREEHQLGDFEKATGGLYVPVGKVDGVYLPTAAAFKGAVRRQAPAGTKWHGGGIVRSTLPRAA